MLRTTIATLFAFAAASAVAEQPSYDYVQVGYQKIEIDDVSPGVDADGDGLGIMGSFEIGDQFHVFGGYARGDFDFDVDIDQYNVGLGWHRGLTNSLDFIAELSYVRAEADFAGFSADEDGYGASIGLRGFASRNVELLGMIDYVDVGSGSGDTSVEGALRYHFSKRFALDVNAGVGDDFTTYGAGFQLYFGR